MFPTSFGSGKRSHISFFSNVFVCSTNSQSQEKKGGIRKIGKNLPGKEDSRKFFRTFQDRKRQSAPRTLQIRHSQVLLDFLKKKKKLVDPKTLQGRHSSSFGHSKKRRNKSSYADTRKNNTDSFLPSHLLPIPKSEDFPSFLPSFYQSFTIFYKTLAAPPFSQKEDMPIKLTLNPPPHSSAHFGNERRRLVNHSHLSTQLSRI